MNSDRQPANDNVQTVAGILAAGIIRRNKAGLKHVEYATAAGRDGNFSPPPE